MSERREVGMKKHKFTYNLEPYWNYYWMHKRSKMMKENCLDDRRVFGVVCIVFGAYSKKDENDFDAKLRWQIVEKLQHRYTNNNNRSTLRSLLLQTHYTHTHTHRRIFNNNFSALLCEISFFHSFLHLFFVYRHIAHRTSHQMRNKLRVFRHRLTILFYFIFFRYFFLLFILLSLYLHFRAIIVFKQRCCWCKILKWFLPLFVPYRCDFTQKKKSRKI